jgi:hypothetical protein
LSSINNNEDIILASNGTGAVRIVGDFSVRRANGNLIGALEEQPIFRVRSDGQVQMLVPSADAIEGAFTIVGGLDGVFQAPVNTGVMLHITGIASSPDPTPSRIYNDAQNSFSAIVSRRYNGTAAAPTVVLANEEIMRLSGTAHNGTTIPGTANQRIVYKALGNQTLTNQGGAIELWATPINTTTLAKVATIDSIGITLESGKVLTGNVTGTATTATFAQSFNTSTLVTNAVSAQLANTATFAQSFNTSTLVTQSVSAGTVTTAAQPAITSVGTLTNLTVAGNITATNYTGLVTHAIREAGTVSGGTVTLNMTTDNIVRCTFANAGMTVAFSNIIPGRTVTLLARKTDGGADTVNTGLTAQNMSTGDETVLVDGVSTVVLTYYSLGTTTADIYCSMNYRP